MIALAPLSDKKEIEKFFKENKIEYNDDSGCVLAIEKENIIGYCLYEITDKGMTVKKISPEKDLMLADGILRSTLHVAAERCIMDAFCSVECKELCNKLSFIKNDNENRLDIDKLFKSSCSCGSN